MNASEVRRIMHSLLARELSAPQVEQLAQASVNRTVASGHALLNEGDRPSGLVFLLQGQVEILKLGQNGQRQALARLDAPTLLGEMSLVTDRPSVATVMAITQCDYQLLTKPQFQRLIASESLAAYKLVVVIAGVLAERLAQIDRKVLELSGQWSV
jgi:CRP/FNR family transcriptional regulator, cyclic AMP receptor protein